MICDNCKNKIDDLLTEEMICPYCHKELSNIQQEEYLETGKNEVINEEELARETFTPNIENSNITLYSHNRPLSAFSFLIMQILFFIPIINLLFLFIFSFKSNINKNRRSFARSILFWHITLCTVLLATLTAAVMLRYPLDIVFWFDRFKNFVNSINF